MSQTTSSSTSSDVPISITNPLPAQNITFNGVNPLDPSHQALEFAVRCIFPISGQFGLMARFLYYFLLAFVLMVSESVVQNNALSLIKKIHC